MDTRVFRWGKIRCITAPSLESAIGLWEAMCIAASIAAQDFCSPMFLPRNRHRILPFSEPFGSTVHDTLRVWRRVCVCVCAVCVRACEYRIRRRSTTQKRGSPRFSRCQRALEARRWAVPSRQPREALCALFYTMALCLMCVFRLRAIMATLPFSSFSGRCEVVYSPPCPFYRCW